MHFLLNDKTHKNVGVTTILSFEDELQDTTYYFLGIS